MKSLLIALGLLILAAQDPSRPAGTSLYPQEGDLDRKSELEATGDVVVGKHVVAWFPAAATTPEDRMRILSELDRGVGAAKALIDEDWAFRGDRRVYFYFPRGRFASHAPGGNSTYVPLMRIMEGDAPWLHEAIHLLLASPDGDWLLEPRPAANANMPLWLEEGMADVIAMDVSAREGLAFHSPMFDASLDELDSACAAALTGPAARVTDYIGVRGRMPELFGEDRDAYAPAFYSCSAAFVRRLSLQGGYGPLIEANLAFGEEIETLERAYGRPLAEMRDTWLREIGAAPIAPPA